MAWKTGEHYDSLQADMTEEGLITILKTMIRLTKCGDGKNMDWFFTPNYVYANIPEGAQKPKEEMQLSFYFEKLRDRGYLEYNTLKNRRGSIDMCRLNPQRISEIEKLITQSQI